MPLYTYKCKDCDQMFEVHQRMTDEPLTQCPVCAGEVRRVINSVGVVFKGKGFYVTDNRKATTIPSGGSGESAKTSDENKPAASTPAEAKPSEAKPAEKST